jgi:hypothetical protein
LQAAEKAPVANARKGAWTRPELAAFMKELTRYVVTHHMRRDDSPMRGKIYEFYMPATGQQGYGGGWDTMHDGAWFANACILAYRASGDPYYLEIVERWVLPFYLKMLNHSDTLFPDRQKAYSDSQVLPPERATACKGSVPYWWDDGHGVNFDAMANGFTLERLVGPKWGATNLLADDVHGRLSGYSHGTSNHLALDLFPMLANYWLVTRDPAAAEALHHLHACRIHQMKMDIAFLAIADLASHGQRDEAYKIAGAYDTSPWPPRSPLYAAMVEKKRVLLPPFIDDPAAAYYASMMGRRVGPGTAKRLAQVTHDCLVLADRWYGSHRRPRGLNYSADSPKQVWIDGGKFTSLAGEIPEVLVGSRMGPQCVWASGLCLQLLAAFPDSWTDYYNDRRPPSTPGWSEPPLAEVKARFQEELDEGLRFWQNQMRTVGYLRPDWPIGGKKPSKTFWRDQTSETGAYAHLISACAVYEMFLDGRRDWELAWQTSVRKNHE